MFSPEQVTAMMLTKLKETATIALNMKIIDCVISVSATGLSGGRLGLAGSGEPLFNPSVLSSRDSQVGICCERLQSSSQNLLKILRHCKIGPNMPSKYAMMSKRVL